VTPQLRSSSVPNHYFHFYFTKIDRDIFPATSSFVIAIERNIQNNNNNNKTIIRSSTKKPEVEDNLQLPEAVYQNRMLLMLRLNLVVQFQQLAHHNRFTLLDHCFTQTLLQQPNPQLLSG
jgi:hypothetical protein